MKDRLKDLQSHGRRDSTLNPGSGETEPLISGEEWNNIEQFLTSVSNVNKTLELLESLLITLKKHQNDILSDPTHDKQSFQKFDELNREFCNGCKQVLRDVNALDSEAKKSLDPSADGRIKKNQMATLRKRLSQIISNYNSDQMEYQEKLKKNTMQYMKIQGIDVSEEVVMEAIDSGDVRGLTKGLVLAVADKKSLYDEVKNRRDELEKLEESLRELHDMFHDLYLLVQSQGDMIDNIEANVDAAGEYADKAKANVIGAKELRNRMNKMKIFICCGLIVLVIILLFILQGLVCHFTPIC